MEIKIIFTFFFNEENQTKRINGSDILNSYSFLKKEYKQNNCILNFKQLKMFLKKKKSLFKFLIKKVKTLGELFTFYIRNNFTRKGRK